MTLRGNRNLVKLDIDAGMRRPTIMELGAKLARAGYRVRWMWERRSDSGKGWHIALKLRPCPRSPEEVVALQAILGSDLWREAATLRKARAFHQAPAWMRDRWNVLYQPRPARRVSSCR